MILFFTATDPQYGCPHCAEVKEVVARIAAGYQKMRYDIGSKKPKHQIFFAVVEYSAEIQTVLQGLQIRGIPKTAYQIPCMYFFTIMYGQALK